MPAMHASTHVAQTAPTRPPPATANSNPAHTARQGRSVRTLFPADGSAHRIMLRCWRVEMMSSVLMNVSSAISLTEMEPSRCLRRLSSTRVQ